MSTSLDRQALDLLLFVAFNGRVIALDRRTGSVIWQWQNATRGSYVCLLPDGDTLFVSCRGYTWALDAASGAELWHQPLKGEGIGIPSLATMRSGATNSSGAAAQQQDDDNAHAAAAG